MNIQEVREKFPQYNDLSDAQLADALHAKFYSDIPKPTFYERIGLSATAPSPAPAPAEAPTAPDVTRGAEMRAYTPSLWEKIQNLFPDNKARAMNELAARRVAQQRGIPVSQAYREAGFERPIFNPEGRAPVRAAVEAAPIIGKELTKIPAGVAETALRTVRGGELSAVDETWVDRTIAAMSKDEDDYDKNYEAFNGLGKSLGFSVASMVASTVAGAAGSVTPLGPVGGVAAGMGTSGTVAYRASKDEFLERVRTKLNKESKRLYGRPLTKDEWKEAQEKFDSAASEYGAWEAIPEAISNAIFLKAFVKPAMGAKASRLQSLAEKATAYASENVTETATGLGQNAAERKAGLTTEEKTIADAFRDQFLQTLAVTGMLGGGMKGKELATQFYNEQVLPRIDPGSALAKAIKADLDSIGYTPAAFRAASAEKVETAIPPEAVQRAAKPVITTPPEEQPEEPAAPPAPAAPPTAERIEPTFDEQAAVTAAPPEGRVEPTLEGAPAAPVAPTEARIEDTEPYKLLFTEYRKQGLTKDDADKLTRRTLQEREEMEAQASAAAVEGGVKGLTPATGLPPVSRWPDAAVTSTLEFQLAKPEDQRNDALVSALEQEVAARGLRPPVGEESVAEPVSAPGGEGVSVAGVPDTGAATGRPAGTERTGVVPTAEDVGQPAVGEGEQPRAVEKTAEELEAEADAAEAPYKARIAQAIDVAKANVSAAFDQRREYGSLQESIDTYRDNVRDTLVELGISDRFTEEAAFREFDRAVQEGLAKETSAPTTTETGAPTATTTKRGRPKAELTPEQQAEKETQRREGRAAYTKADRQVKRAVQTLDELATPLDESQFATEEDLKAAQADRVSRKREAIRTLLQVEPSMRGTALGKRIKEALGRPDISAKEKADISAGIEALKKSGKAPLQSTDPTLRIVNPALAGVTNGEQAISAIIRNGNAFQKLIANRLRSIVGRVRVVVVEKDTPVPEELQDERNADAWEGARGLYIERPDGSQVVYLRGATFGADQGVNNVTALHELLHAATSQKLYLGLRALQNRISVNSQIARFTREVSTIMARSSYVYGLLDEQAKIPKELAQLVESTLRFDENGNPYYAIFEEPHEFLAYGMSDPLFQEFLNAVPDTQRQPVSLFSRFVEAVRASLGIPANATTSLTNLVNATDQILSGRKTPWMRRAEATERREAAGFSVVAAENKRTGQKVNETLRKIRRSREAQNVVEGLGGLTKGRASVRLQDLLAAGWDTFNIAKLKTLLPALMTDTIVQWGNRLDIKGLDRAWRGMQDMSAMRANMLTSAAEVTREWLKLQPGIARRVLGAKSEMNALADVMHYSTDKGIDPSKKTTDPTLNKMWAALSPEAKKIYERVRDSYKTYFDLYRLLLDKRIEDLNIPGDTKNPDTPKGRLMAEIKKLYETGKAITPYFPLMRYGDYWLSIGTGKKREFYMFESAIDRDLFRRSRMREAEAAGATLVSEQGNSLATMRERSMVGDTSGLLKDIFGAIDEAGALADKEALKDQIYQLYLTTMPEQSFRSQFIHRKGTTGFSGDALRNYITSTMNMANQLSRLKYGPQVLLDIEAARKSLEERPDRDKLEMLVDEMKMRAEMEIFPPAEDALARSAANVANRTAFLYYMTSVKTALSQFASIPIFGVPVLLSRHNPVQVAKEMGRFMLVFNELGVLKEEDGKTKVVMPTITESRAVRLNPDEQAAIEAMRDRGLADITLTFDLMDRREVPTTKYIGAWKTATNMMGALFHNVERLNREVMYLSSFRLTMNELEPKIKSGQLSRNEAIELAIEQATNDTYTALGNFTEGNRPRIARGPLGKVGLQFKTFPAFVTTYMVRNFYRMTAGMNKEEKKEAATQFFGTLGMSYLLAGYVGIPGIAFAFGVVQALLNQFKDDEDEDPLEKKDLETWFRNVWIPNVFGEAKIGDKPVGEIVDAGVLNSITGYDMNSSLSMNNMWFPEVKEGATYAATWQDYAISLMGPFAGIVLKQIPGAMDDFRAGKFDRGVEKLMPNLIRQPMAAARYSKEGATTPAGDVIKEADEFTRGQLVMQALGYRTEGLADVQTANFKANAIRQKVMQEKNRLVARLDLELQQGTDEEFGAALEEAIKFGWRYPSLQIDPNDYIKMLERRQLNRAKADRGFRVDEKFYPFLEELLESSRTKIEREAAKK